MSRVSEEKASGSLRRHLSSMKHCLSILNYPCNIHIHLTMHTRCTTVRRHCMAAPTHIGWGHNNLGSLHTYLNGSGSSSRVPLPHRTSRTERFCQVHHQLGSNRPSFTHNNLVWLHTYLIESGSSRQVQRVPLAGGESMWSSGVFFTNPGTT
jgi:hypothetical protein